MPQLTSHIIYISSPLILSVGCCRSGRLRSIAALTLGIVVRRLLTQDFGRCHKPLIELGTNENNTEVSSSQSAAPPS